jgi:hypothetical protein
MASLGVEAAEHFLAALRVHGRQLAHEFIARSPFRVTAPPDAYREESGYYPNGNISFGDYRGRAVTIRSSARHGTSPSDWGHTAAATVNLGVTES